MEVGGWQGRSRGVAGLWEARWGLVRARGASGEGSEAPDIRYSIPLLNFNLNGDLD